MADIPFEFRELNIYEAEGQRELKKVTPVNQIPVLLDGERPVWDSRVIFSYLVEKHGLPRLTWDHENLLTAVDGALNAGVALHLMKRSGVDVTAPLMIAQRHRERIASVLDFLRSYAEGPGLSEWNFVTMSLYSFLDWALFRGVITLDGRPGYETFLSTHAERPEVRATRIPENLK
jgi:glutathione S-transferase